MSLTWRKKPSTSPHTYTWTFLPVYNYIYLNCLIPIPMYVWFESKTWKRGQSTSPYTYTCTFYLYIFTWVYTQCISFTYVCMVRVNDMEKRTIYIPTYIYLYIITCTFLPECLFNLYLCRYGSYHWHGEEDHLYHYIHIPVHFYLSVYLSLTSVGMVRAIDMERKTIYITTPLSLVDLVYVNTLIRGSSNVPQQIFTEQITRVGYSTYLCTRPWQRFSEQIFLVGLLQSYLKGS